MRAWSINKENLGTCMLLQIRTVEVVSESRNSHAGGEWEMVTKVVCTNQTLERPSPSEKDEKLALGTTEGRRRK